MKLYCCPGIKVATAKMGIAFRKKSKYHTRSYSNFITGLNSDE